MASYAALNLLEKYMNDKHPLVTVREATLADVDAVHELIVAIAKHHDQLQHVQTTPTLLREAGFGTQPQFGVLLAEVNGAVAGYASYTWNYSIWLAAQYMNIDDVFVWEAHRDQRVGEALMIKAQEVCRARGCRRVRWEVQADNHKAIRFYERLGAVRREKGIFIWNV
jgi:ribosomal protein S18 acetylase RimI-like enzyme